MLHILMIPVRQIIHAFASTIIVKYQKQSPRGVLFCSTSEILMFSRIPFKKVENLVILDFPHFVF